MLNGWGVGETHWGGLAQRARLNGDWLVPLPDNFTARQAMAIGTAGYTASLSVDALVNHGVTPDRGEILVTGATGGFGSVAIALLATAGFTVAAATGKASAAEYLKGSAQRPCWTAPSSPMPQADAEGALGGVIDSVGSHTLANACAQTRYGGTVAACGLAQGMDFPASVAPFILRGVSLLGIESVMAPREPRMAAWARLSRDLDASALDAIANEIRLGDAIDAAGQLLDGKVRGRIVVDVNR